MSDNPIAKLYVLDDDGNFKQIEPSTIAGAVSDKTNNDTVQKFIDDGVMDWEEGIKSDEQYPSARLVYESLDELKDTMEDWYANSVRYKGIWDATEQVDFSSIQLPVKMGYSYRVIGDETIINGRKFQDGDLIIINRDVEKDDVIVDEDVILLLGYGNEQTKINRVVIDVVPTYADLLTYDKIDEIQLNSVMIVANDERHNDLLSFYEYIEGYNYDISFDTYAEMMAYQMSDAYVENYEYDKDSVNHIFTLNKYTGVLTDVPVPVVVYRTIDISIARVVHDENYDNTTKYYRYNPETETWELLTDIQNNWVYMFSRKETTAEGVYRVKGSVETYDDLPESGNVVGDVYNILDTGANYVWTDEGWDKLSETVDLTNYYTKTEVQNLILDNVNSVISMVSNTYYNKSYINDEFARVDLAISGLSDRVDGINTTVNSISNRVNSIESSVNTITNNVSNLQDVTSSLSGRMNTVEGDVIVINGTINTITNNVSTISSNVNTLAQDLSENYYNKSSIDESIGIVTNTINNVASDLDTNYYDKSEVDSLIQHIGEALPSQEGHAGEFLTTDGTDASWANIGSMLPDQTGHEGHQLFTNGTDAYWDSPIPSVIWKRWDE